MKKIGFLLFLFSTFTWAQQATFEQKIHAIIASKKATVAVSVLGIENNFNYHKNGEKKLPMQSVFKFHIASAVLDFVDQGKLSLDQKILVKKADLLQHTWSPIREKYPNGNVKLSLNEIIYFTVALSDNNGCDILLRLIGGPRVVQKFIDSKGIRDFQIKFNEEEMHKAWNIQYENYTTSHSAVQVLKKLYTGKLLSKPSTDYLIKVMLGTKTGTNKLIEQLPKGTPVAHKTGSSGKNKEGMTGAENDMGVITLPNGKHYAIAVLVSNSYETENVNCKIVSDISKAVWNYLNK